MATTVMAGPEIALFRDIALGKLEILSSLGARALTGLEDVDKILQEAEQPMPVLSVSAHHIQSLRLPSIWMGLGVTEPGKGLQYAEDAYYIPKPKAPSIKVPIHGLAIPVAHDSVSSVKFFPFTLPDKGVEVPSSWWEHWQRHRFTQQAGDYKYVSDYKDEIGFPPFATWFRQKTNGDLYTKPTIVIGEPDASEVQLIPSGEYGSFYDDRHKAAIFVGNNAVQSVLANTSRIGIPKELATEPFHSMMAMAANELSLKYMP